MDQSQLYDIMRGEDTTLSGRAIRLGLTVMQPGYRLAVAARNRLFDVGLRKPLQLLRPTISVGNLTAGGTGKTPMVIELARRLIEQGSHPAVLLRGYMSKGGDGPSDEAAQLKNELGSSVPVEPDPSRADAARRVIKAHPEVSVFLLDDGFQHRQVHRDLDIVLIDATRPFGFDHLLPRGLLREPVGNLGRADAVIVTRSDLVDPQALAKLDQQITQLTGRAPIAHTASRWTGFRHGDDLLPADHLRDLKVSAVTAIGNPGAFEQMLRTQAGRVLACHDLDDHHHYTAEQIRGLMTDALAQKADALVVTEKDWVKWVPLLNRLPGGSAPNSGKDVSILRPVLGVEFLDGGQAVDQLLRQVTESRP